MSFISGSDLIDSGQVEGRDSCIPRRKFGIEAGWMGWTAIKSLSFYNQLLRKGDSRLLS